MSVELARAEVCRVARRMHRDGLVVGTAGNVSARHGDMIAVTPSGFDYEDMTPNDVPVVNLAGEVVLGDLDPTTEVPMHLAAYRRLAAGAVVHTHAVHATAVSTLVDEVPPIHYVLASAGPSVRVAGYATYGTEELAENMCAGLDGRSACLLRNHGTLAIGPTLSVAYDRTVQLEWMCQVWLAASAVGRPTLLTAEQIEHAAEKLSGYGQTRP